MANACTEGCGWCGACTDANEYRDDDATGDVAPSRFHAHLDTCKQCREHPMQLCKVGAVLLKNSAGVK